MAKINMEKLLPFYDAIEQLCLQEYEAEYYTEPFELLQKMMDLPGMPMHCPPHHLMIPALLLTCMSKKNNVPKELLEEWLAQARERALNVLGGFCGWYGSCGAAVGTGIFMSIYTETNPHSHEHWADCNRTTARALMDISEVEGPRCCKRNSFIALHSAIDTIKEVLHVDLGQSEHWVCKYYDRNGDCKKEACPFYPGGEK